MSTDRQPHCASLSLATVVACGRMVASGALGCTVLVVEDEAKVREAYCRILDAEGYTTVGARHLVQATSLLDCSKLRFDVAVLDLKLPDGCGADLIGPLLRHHAACRAVVLSGKQDRTAVVRALEVGAHEFLPKPISPRELVDHVDLARQSSRSWRMALAWATGEDCREQLAPHTGVEGTSQGPPITDAQRAVLSLLERGLTNSEIAHLLQISQNTARNHVSAVLSKLGIPCRSQVPARALGRLRRVPSTNLGE